MSDAIEPSFEILALPSHKDSANFEHSFFYLQIPYTVVDVSRSPGKERYEELDLKWIGVPLVFARVGRGWWTPPAGLSSCASDGEALAGYCLALVSSFVMHDGESCIPPDRAVKLGLRPLDVDYKLEYHAMCGPLPTTVEDTRNMLEEFWPGEELQQLADQDASPGTSAAEVLARRLHAHPDDARALCARSSEETIRRILERWRMDPQSDDLGLYLKHIVGDIPVSHNRWPF